MYKSSCLFSLHVEQSHYLGSNALPQSGSMATTPRRSRHTGSISSMFSLNVLSDVKNLQRWHRWKSHWRLVYISACIHTYYIDTDMHVGIYMLVIQTSIYTYIQSYMRIYIHVNMHYNKSNKSGNFRLQHLNLLRFSHQKMTLASSHNSDHFAQFLVQC